MANHSGMIRQEITGEQTAVMKKYVAHFHTEAETFVAELAHAVSAWEQYQAGAVKREDSQPELVWSAAYLLNAINAALISTRLFLSGYIAPSGNQARTSVESLAFGVLLPFKETGVFEQWRKEHPIEHKALELLRRHARHCGVDEKNVGLLLTQAKWFDNYSHPSRLTLATVRLPEAWHVGALFVEEHLPQYRQEMGNRVSLSQLLLHTIAGVHAHLIEKGLQDRPT